jgi:proliferating cell nuclear antigen
MVVEYNNPYKADLSLQIMIVKLDKPKLLGDAVNILSEIVTEVRIKMLEEGMSIVAVDPANVALVVFKLPKESFSQYEVNNEVLGINLADLKLILRRASASSNIVFEQEENQLKISIFDKIKRIFHMALIDVESEDKEEPDLQFSSTVQMASESFSKAIEDCNIVADSCSFIAGKEFFVIEGAGNLNSARSEFSGDEAKMEGIGKSKYSIEYLMKFIKAAKLSDQVIIKFSDDYPLRLDFPGESMGMGFVLAPRVEND